MANMYVEGTLTEFYPEYYARPRRAAAVPAGVLLAVRVPEPSLAGAARRDPRGRRARLRALDLVRRGARQPGPDRRLHRRRRRGGDRADGGRWHGNKFVNPATDGAVLPDPAPEPFQDRQPDDLRHDEPTRSSRASSRATAGTPSLRFARAARSTRISMRRLAWAYDEIRRIQRKPASGRPPERPRWPMIVLETPKGLGCPQGARRQACSKGRSAPTRFPCRIRSETRRISLMLERWLRSYRPEELFDAEGRPAAGHPVALPAAREAHRDESARASAETAGCRSSCRRSSGTPSVDRGRAGRRSARAT